MVEALDARAVEPDVVGGPADTELLDAGGQLADKVGEPTGVGVASGLGVARCGHPVDPPYVPDAYAGQQVDLLAPQARHTTPSAVGGQSCLLGGDPGPPRGQELADLVPGVHAPNATSVQPTVGGPASTPNNRVSLTPAPRGMVNTHPESSRRRRKNPWLTRRFGSSPVPDAAWASRSRRRRSPPAARSWRPGATPTP